MAATSWTTLVAVVSPPAAIQFMCMRCPRGQETVSDPLELELDSLNNRHRKCLPV